ncbi:PINIT domain-containing protein [Cercophora scortea]|uniref:PINIT domain-containing protein n=1 Tax=Cercophora scortea TaxID=314031 RepID=A0AAE0MJF6_9PEZI|nr:PINIT domain-containing protein [Cercophora scortea]
MESTGPSEAEVQALIRTISIPAIQKPVLQSICVANGLAKTGNKSDLQRRIQDLIRECKNNADDPRFRQVRDCVFKHAPVHASVTASMHLPPTTSQPLQQKTGLYPPASSQNPAHYAMSGYAPGGSYGVPTRNREPPLQHQSFTYKPSPFYEIKYRIGDVKTCEAMAQHRHSVTLPIKAGDHPMLQECITDPTMRVMIFCAGGNTGAQDISFPHQSELKVNDGDIKANLRGLKNKPGSTRPVDITASLRLKPLSYQNNIEFTYALTQKKFYLGLYICKSTPVDALVGQIQKKIRKESVITEIAKKANDPDVVATSQNLSLKCPLSYMRLSLPCRALSCSHIQCFDATSYLQLQEQGPQWICPVCNKPAPFDQLAVDEYVREILVETSESVEQVTIEPDGKWAAPGMQRAAKSESHEASFLDDEDFVISEYPRSRNQSNGTPARAGTVAGLIGTPTTNSRDSSAMPRSATSNKRTLPEVIDLTFSDDDDEPPARPMKRQNYGSNGYSGSY